MKRRREKVAAAVAKGDPLSAVPPSPVSKLASTMWSGAHQKELDRSSGLERKRRFPASNL